MDKALRYLGLATRAGCVCLGLQECTRALRGKGSGRVLAAAADAGAGTLRQAEKAARGRCRLIYTAYTKMDLAGAVGSSQPVALVLITGKDLAAAFASAVLQLRGIQEEKP